MLFLLSFLLLELEGGEVVDVLDEGFGGIAAALEAAEFFHGAVPLVDVFHVLAHVAVAGLVLALQYRLDVHPVGGVEQLALRA